MIRMMVHGLTIDPASNSPVLLLKDANSQTTLPIWIGLLEATSIASELEKVTFARPMSHDLMRTIIGSLGYTVSKIALVDLQENTFFAELHLMGPGGLVTVDARPSDAIALALRCDAPIFVALKVIDQAGAAGQQNDHVDTKGKWKDLLERMSPEDFGKYKM